MCFLSCVGGNLRQLVCSDSMPRLPLVAKCPTPPLSAALPLLFVVALLAEAFSSWAAFGWAALMVRLLMGGLAAVVSSAVRGKLKLVLQAVPTPAVACCCPALPSRVAAHRTCSTGPSCWAQCSFTSWATRSPPGAWAATLTASCCGRWAAWRTWDTTAAPKVRPGRHLCMCIRSGRAVQRRSGEPGA